MSISVDKLQTEYAAAMARWEHAEAAEDAATWRPEDKYLPALTGSVMAQAEVYLLRRLITEAYNARPDR